MASSKSPGLYEFLIEAELQQYYAGFKNDLKIQNVPQLKYVTEEDLFSIGMSKPEMRRLKKFFQKHFPQNYLSKIKKLILSKREDSNDSILPISSEPPEKPTIKVPNKHIISAEAIIVNKELGQGEFGVVQQGVWTDEDERIQVAIKCLSRERMQNNPIEFLKEAAIMHGIDHEHIVRLYGVVLDTNSLMLVTELAPLRSLLECLKEPSLRSSFPVLSLCHFAIQVCDGMQYLEQKRLIHRDLAARNILVFSKNKVKISDFGLSRALGVGKDYYQTNFNVNLKLPIAWCAPECISYLRFTSASDVWAYGVTLWEMFSYGFQPWAALTGQQILEAIDEPNFQRLEQPECCPREYYSVMLKCWQHDPNKRPRFSDLLSMLPDCKPEQVQTVNEFVEDPTKSKRDQLVYKLGDVITVLDKQHNTSCWKGVSNNGKTGLFNPANTIAYIGNLPSNKVEFTRGDGKNVYSSKRKIRPDMISGPQGDLKHTGHVGLDGAYFGDLSFLGGKNPNLPRQIVTPYKPHEDSSSCETESNQAGLSRTCSDISDCTPLLTTTQNENMWVESIKHEYHEISDDDDDQELGGSPVFHKSFDYGPSLMDEMESVLRSLGGSPIPPAPTERKKPPPPFTLTSGNALSTPPASPLAEAINVKNELKEMAAKAAGSCKKKQATVKPISAAEERTLDCAIAMANELAARSMNDLDGVTPPESPHTPVSPNKRKFSFRFPSVSKHSSPKAERRNFSEQTACIPDIQSSLSPEAKEVYNSLVEQPMVEAQTMMPTITRITHCQPYTVRTTPPNLSSFGHPQPSSGSLDSDSDSNPLRMLKSGIFPVVRPRGRVTKVPPPPTAPPPVPESSQRKESVTSQSSQLSEDDNPIPLPPRDRTKATVVNKRHHRKHPLIIPPGVDVHYSSSSTPDEPNDVVSSLPPAHPSNHPNNAKPSEHDDSFEQQIATELDALDEINIEHDEFEEQQVRTKPNVHLKQKIALLNQHASFYSQSEDDDVFYPQSIRFQDQDIGFVDASPDELRKHDDHVSCEDLFEFSNKTKSKSRGRDSDEVRIMSKVLGSEVSSEECLNALSKTNWEVHGAIKLARLSNLLKSAGSIRDLDSCWEALNVSDGDVAKAASSLITAQEGLAVAFV